MGKKYYVFLLLNNILKMIVTAAAEVLHVLLYAYLPIALIVLVVLEFTIWRHDIRGGLLISLIVLLGVPIGVFLLTLPVCTC